MSNLQNRDFYVFVDKSGSMGDTDTPTGQTRFKYAEESTIAIAKMLEAYDPDGITVIPFASTFKPYENTTAARVADVFRENQPFGGTTLGPALQWMFNDYNTKKKAGQSKENGAIGVVITDGAPSDPDAVASAIAKFTQTLDGGDDEFGLAFFQVGKDAGATAFLRGLDDNIKGAKYDIVDAKTFDEIESIGLEQALIAALND